LVADPTLDLPLNLPGIRSEIKVPASDEAPTLSDVLCDALFYVGDAPFERSREPGAAIAGGNQ
jgi:hypothetical protein